MLQPVLSGPLPSTVVRFAITTGASGSNGAGVPSIHVASTHIASADEDSHSIPPPRAVVAPQPRAVAERRQLVLVSQCLRTHVPVPASGVGGQGARALQWLQ